MRTLPFRLGLVVALCSVLKVASAEVAPDRGEAFIWYLGHAGWAIRTSEHWLVFDYTGPTDAGALDEGALSGEVLGDRQVILFVSHAHGDHFDPRVLELRGLVANLKVVTGWDEAALDAVVPADGEWTDVSGVEVFALHHEFDGLPEGFFVVRSGGVTIYHSGDHGTWKDPPDATFRSNVDAIKAAAEVIDLAFVASFGKRGSREVLNAGDVYTLRTLVPRVAFPMHCGGCEDRYSAFASEAKALKLGTKIGVAHAPGASFRYAGGRLVDNR